MALFSWLMFDRRDHALLDIVADVLDRDKTQEYKKRRYYPHFHPRGVKEMAESRGLRIAYAVVHLLESLEAGKMEERVGALASLRDEVLNASDGPMPKNTARVLIQIMKELVRCRDDRQRQLRLAHDFRMAATGKPRIVRRQLRAYHLLEMPEAWNQIAFDDHVHDVNTKGRKSATHLIMDAWIKGIRRLRVIYYNHIQAKFIAELLEAAAIMGIDVRIGIEFSARFRGRYVPIIWVPRGFVDTPDFLCFLTEPAVQQIMALGREASAYRQGQVLLMLAEFNRQHRPAINQRFGITLDPINPMHFLSFVKPGQASLLHLARYIHGQLLPHLQAKAALFRQLYPAADQTGKQQMEDLVREMDELDAETIQETYLAYARNLPVLDPDVVHDGPDVPPLLKLDAPSLIQRLVGLRTGHRLTLNLTDLTPADVLELLYDCDGAITRLEIFNLKDHAAGKSRYAPEICRLQTAINEGNVITLKRIIGDIIADVAAGDAPDKADRLAKLDTILHDIASLRLMYKATPLKARIGTDSTGQSARMHGMGLAVIDTLPAGARRQIRDPDSRRMVIPIHMAALRNTTFVPLQGLGRPLALWFHLLGLVPGLNWLGQQPRQGWQPLEQSIIMREPGNIVTLGGIHEQAGNGLCLTDCPAEQPGSALGWDYLNSLAKNTLKVLGGFIPAFFTFALRYEWWVLKFGGALIWFAITGIRNIVQAVLGGGGLQRSPLMRWNDFVSWNRICDSLLYTGFSVPLLDWLVKSLLLERALGITTATHPALLYAVMALANGIYLSSHNAFRGFSRSVIFGNFFRSVLSIPIAVAFNAIIGGALGLCGVVGVAAILQKWAAVISKAASDFVAALIEGTADRRLNIRVRLADYRDKLTRLNEVYTQLELLFPEKRALEALGPVTADGKPLSGDAKDLEVIVIIHALDLLYFWYYQPRGQTALRTLARTLSAEERALLLGTLAILKRQRQISLLFIEGMIGKNFSKGLAFYLNTGEAYLSAVQNLLQLNPAATTPAGSSAQRQRESRKTGGPGPGGGD